MLMLLCLWNFPTLDDQIEIYGDNTYRYDDDGYLIEKVTPTGTTSFILRHPRSFDDGKGRSR